MLSFHEEEHDISTEVDALVTFMSELKAAVWHGLSLKLRRLKRKVQSFVAEVAVSSVDEKSILAFLIRVRQLAEAGGRRRRGQTSPSTPALQIVEARSSATETHASLVQLAASEPSIHADGLRQRPLHRNDDDRDDDTENRQHLPERMRRPQTAVARDGFARESLLAHRSSFPHAGEDVQHSLDRDHRPFGEGLEFDLIQVGVQFLPPMM